MESTRTPKLSVIVPVYKVEQYLPSCIESVLKQTFTDFELLLIDDGSPDRSGEICDEYAERDSRIRVFHKENGGVSAARNVGLDNARGEWVSFVDSDDWVDEKYLQSAVAMCNRQIDMIHVGFVYCDESFDVKYTMLPQDKVYSPKEFLAIDRFCGTVWSYLIRRELIESYSIRFTDTLHHGEDWEFLVKCILHARLVRGISVARYFYICRPESAYQSKHDYSKIQECLILIKNIHGYLAEDIKISPVSPFMMKWYREAVKSYINRLLRDRPDDVPYTVMKTDLCDILTLLEPVDFGFSYRLLFRLFVVYPPLAFYVLKGRAKLFGFLKRMH